MLWSSRNLNPIPQSVACQVQSSIASIQKGNWMRKDGSHWMNDRGFIEPFRKLGKIPSHEQGDPDYTGKGEGGEGGERKEQVWVNNPFSNKEELIHYFQENSQGARFLFPIHTTDLPCLSEYKKVWSEEFGNGSINTPLGSVKLGENQAIKNYTKNDQRYRYIGLIKPTLESPNFILKREIMEKNDKERDYTLHFVKGFNKDGKLIQYFTTTIQKSGNEIMISSFPRSIRQIYKLMNAGKVLFYTEPQPSKSPELHVQNPALKGDSSSVNDIIKGNFVNEEIAPGKTPHERIKMKPSPLPTSETAPTIRTTNSKLSGTSRLYESGLQTIGEVTIPNPDQLTKPGEREESFPKNKLFQWIINASKNQENEMDNNQAVSKGFFGFGKNKQPSPTGSGSPPGHGLVKKQIIDSRGRNQTKWVRPDEVQTPIERKREDAKDQRKKIIHLNHSQEDKQKIEEITKRHKEFEGKIKDQRRTFGSGPQLPKPGIIMRVYAKGKVNVGGMLAEVQRIAEDGKSVFATLTSGKTYEFPLEQLHFAKSILIYGKAMGRNE